MKLSTLCFRISMIGLVVLIAFSLPVGALADADVPNTATPTNTAIPTNTPDPTQTPTNTPVPTDVPYIPPPSYTPYPDPYVGVAGADLGTPAAPPVQGEGGFSTMDIFLIGGIVLALIFLGILAVRWVYQNTRATDDPA